MIDPAGDSIGKDGAGTLTQSIYPADYNEDPPDFEDEVVIVLNNLSTLEQNISIPAPVAAKQVNDLLTKTTYHIQENTLNVKLNPRQYLWLA